jgi:hypothetical protein
MMARTSGTDDSTSATDRELPRLRRFIPWAVIMLSFGSAVDSSSSNPRPPAFVYAIGPTPLDLCSLLAINRVLQYKKTGVWEDSLFREIVYVILSLAAKTVLCWPIWSGTPAPATCKPLLAPVTQTRIRDPERKRGVP